MSCWNIANRLGKRDFVLLQKIEVSYQKFEPGPLLNREVRLSLRTILGAAAFAEKTPWG